MGISPWQSTCLILLGAILAVLIDEGGNSRIARMTNCQSTQKRPSSSSSSSFYVDRFSNVESSSSTKVDYETVMDAVNAKQQRIKTLQTQAQTKWNQALTTTTSPINYLRDPVAFIEHFQTCVNHKDCFIMYQHVSKTGGTTLEQALYPVFGQETVHTCCHQRLRSTFLENVDAYCQDKFTSWQMFDDELLELVQTCQKRDPQRQTLVLTTFREPTQTLISYIHQMCNKMLHKRSPQLQEACQSCVYENHTEVFDYIASIIEHQIEGAFRLTQSLRDVGDPYYVHENDVRVTVQAYHKKNHDVQNFTVDKSRILLLTMETNDVSSFLWHWQPEVVFGVANSAASGSCSFRLTTELLKKLRPALSIYRKLLAGL